MPIFLSCLLALSQTLHAQSPFTLDQTSSNFELGTHLQYIEDPDGVLDFEDAKTLRESGKFLPGENKVLNFGFTKSHYWFYINIQNEVINTPKWVLEVLYPLLDQVEVFYKNEQGELINMLAGDSVPFHFRSFSSQNINFAMTIPYGKNVELYLRTSSEGTVEMPLKIWEEKAYLDQIHDKQLVFGIYYGLLLAMFFYNLMLFISIKDLSYLLCSLYIASYGLFQFSLNGLSLEYIWPLEPHLNNLMVIFFISVGMTFILIFSRSFLKLKNHSIFLDRVLKFFIFYFIVTCTINFYMPYKNIIPIATLGTLISAIFIITSAIYCLYKNFRPAKYFLLSWIALLTGMISYTLKTFSILPSSFFTEYGIQIGSSFEVILLSFALADRIRVITDENHQMQEEANSKLQNQVKERTKALEQQTQHAYEAKAEAEQAALAKSQFLASMSHEIRTPLNGVLGMIELLKTTPLNNEQLEYVSTVHNSGHALVRVINDILDYSKIESGKFDIEHIPLNVSQLLDDCTSIFSFTAMESGVQLYTKIDLDVPDVIISDPTRIKQILINYLSNAFKFTDQGKVVIHISKFSNEGEEDRLRFSVKDTGVGIETSKIPKVFEMFSQADSSTTRQYGGTGLGLAICKKLALLLGGDAHAESELGAGSDFYFEILLTSANKEETLENKKQYSSLEGKKLLIVDPSKTFQETYRFLASSWDMECAICTIEEFQNNKIFEGHQYDAVLLNISTASSVDSIQSIKNNAPNCAIIASTDSPHKELCQKIMESEHLDYLLEKPFTRIQLQKTLLRSLGLTEGVKTYKDRDEVDFSNLHILIAEDNPVNQMVIKGGMKKMKANYHVVNDGLEVVEAFRQNMQQFDLILMDCEMPNLDGYGATKQIRTIEQGSNIAPIKIYALSAHALKEFEDKGRESGMDGYLTKPINKAELINLFMRVSTEKKLKNDQSATDF